MTRTFFVTATGTDLGKTYVLCRILQQLRGRGRHVMALKPVLSGFDEHQASDSDSGRILAALGEPRDVSHIQAISPWRFRAALSPDMAAAREGCTVRLDDVARFCRDRFSLADGICFVEGAGGVLSPLGEGFTNLDLVQSLGCQCLLVAGGYLGTISHTLTAVAAMQSRGCAVDAVILSSAQDGPVPTEETAATIAKFCNVPIHIVHRNGPVPDALLDQLVFKA